MDMIFRGEDCRVRADHAPTNFTTRKHMAHNLIRKAPGQSRPLPRVPRKTPHRMRFSPDSPVSIGRAFLPLAKAKGSVRAFR